MNGNGIMQEIRTLQSQGQPSGELIARGYKRSTVYKVMRQMRRRGQGDGRVSAPGNAQTPATTADNQLRSELEAENIRLRQEVETLEGQLECVVDGDAGMEARVQTLRERVKALEAEAAAAGQLRQRVKQLEGQLEHAAHTQAAMRQGVTQWRQRVAAEQAARQKAEGQASTLGQENRRMSGQFAEFQQWAAQTQSVFQYKDFVNGNASRRPRILWSRVVPWVPASWRLFHQTVFTVFSKGFRSLMLGVHLCRDWFNRLNSTRFSSISTRMVSGMKRQQR